MIANLIGFVIESLVAVWIFSSAVKEWKNEDYFMCGLSLVGFFAFATYATQYLLKI